MPARSIKGAPVPTESQQGAPVHASSKKGGLASALFFTDASEKDLNSDATLKTTEQQRKWRPKKPQEAPVAVESPQKAPVPKSQDWRKLNFSEPLKQEWLQQQKPQSPSLQGTLPAESPQKAPRLQQQKPQSPSLQGTQPDNISKGPRLKIPEPLRGELLQQRPQASPPQGPPMPARSIQGAPVPTESQQGAPVHASSKKGGLASALFFTDASEKDLNSDATLKPTEQQRKWRPKKPQEAPVAVESPQKAPRLQQQKPQSPSLQGTQPDNISKGPRLKIPEPLRGELLQQRPQASPPQGPPMPARSIQGAPVPTESQQGAPVHASSKKGGLASALFFTDASEKDLNSDATLKTTEQQRKWRPKKPQEAPVAVESPQKAPGTLPAESRQKAPVPTGFPQGPPVPKSQDWRKLNFSEPLKQERLQQQKPQSPSLQGTLPDNISKRPRLNIPEPLREELLQQSPQAYSPQGAPIPDKTSNREKLEVPEH
ncbi:basic salivary proline-rich protein 1-like [Rhinichthys klamathensis goyatoka]|uniref:basic salivary proline-rich protein 1-like n=1 Tax=Rhinichthys klamathensis goyatoka TaxID=3034132 RepID=UPI0024B5DD2E|nr:basic salivary proline-rich protein 1-like [Rhinichthys klamathensis goyatoka]